MKYLVLLFVTFIASTSAKPAESATGHSDFIQDVRSAFQPVEGDLRNIIKESQDNLQHVAQEAQRLFGELVENSKSTINNFEAADRANTDTKELFRSTVRSITDDANLKFKNLIEKTLTSIMPSQESQRSLTKSAGDAVRSLEGKYLTSDGRNLVDKLVENIRSNIMASGQSDSAMDKTATDLEVKSTE